MADGPKFESIQRTIRLPEPMLQIIESLAASEHRSFNRQVIYLLEQSLLEHIRAKRFSDMDGLDD